MLLAIDAGNTTVMHGVFQGSELRGSWRLLSERPRTSDEWGMALSVQSVRMGWALQEISGVIISSVVPAFNPALHEMCLNYLNIEPLFVDHRLNLGMEILYSDPRQVGADRLCSAVAGRNRYGAPLIIIDLGTATTFDVLNADGNYLGGVISPGIEAASSILHQRTAKLPQVELRFPDRIIGRDTESSIQSGLLYGLIGSLEGLIARIRKELNAEAPVVATGGQSVALQEHMHDIDYVDNDLVLTGLHIIYEQNRPTVTS